GDMVVMFTDGVTEAINERQEDFGLDRMIRIVMQHRDQDARSLVELVEREVMAFAGGQHQYDDITMMIIKAV
ncbi:MAG: SpoIIE family protein phosphatase, partial [Syntrophales bacterium]|nr:SpoIIE family protein phosphatase [Syntrophales bacterium]